MNLAIVGATGQVGSDVLAAARRRPGITSVVLGRDVVNLDDPDGIAGALADVDFDVLVNCAGYTAVDRAESEPAAAFGRNGYAVEGLAEACARAGARLVQLGTDYVFDGETDRPYRPEDAPAPLNVYGASKLVGEALSRRAHGDTLIVRSSSVFGLAGASRPSGNFVETMLRLARERDRLTVVADTVMAPTYSADLAGALLALVEAKAPAGVYHVTNAGRASWHDLAVEALAAAGLDTPVDPVPSEAYPTPARRPRFSVLDTGAATALTGPLPPWRDALRRYLAARAG